jgi:hypothetical protein
VQRHGARLRVLVALAVVLLVALAVALVPGGGPPAAAGDPVATIHAADEQPAVSATVGSIPTGQPMPTGFVGVSFEYKALHQYTGRNPDAVNPALISLLRGLAPGQSPVLRIGGDSTDWTWWPVRGAVRPVGISYNLTKGWLRTTHALAAALDAKLILGINLATSRPALAADEAQTLVQGIGRQYVSALEIGNEPDLYGVFAWYRDRLGHVVYSRPHNYSISAFTKDFSRWHAALPSLPLVGPSFAELTWLSGLNNFLAAEPAVKTVTVHRYPLHGSTTDPTDPTYPSIPDLLSDNASAGLAQQVAPYVATAHQRGLKFRVDEMNSVSDSGRAGVSDTFASALWMVDTLFAMARSGVDGVNIHTLPEADYRPFAFTKVNGHWEATVEPEYYGLLLFTEAAPPGSRLLPVSTPSDPDIRVRAAVTPNGLVHLVLINDSLTTDQTITLRAPAGTGKKPAILERLTAPGGATATTGVTLAGQSFGDETTTGTLNGPFRAAHLTPTNGVYTVDLPASSAAMVSFAPAPKTPSSPAKQH